MFFFGGLMIGIPILGQTGPIGKNTTLSFVGSELIQS